MPAPVSILIPTLNSEAALPATLLSLVEGLEAGVIRELVAADGGSSDRTREIVEEAGARIVDALPGRGGQLREGSKAARGDWLLILHADTHLPAGWSDAVRDHIRNHPDQAACFRLEFRARGAMARMTAGWANLRTRVFGLPYGDQGLIIRVGHLEEIGGVPDIPLMEDVAVARNLRGRLRMLDLAVRTSADRYISEGWVRRGALNLLTLSRYLLGADPVTLARAYGRGRGGGD